MKRLVPSFLLLAALGLVAGACRTTAEFGKVETGKAVDFPNHSVPDILSRLPGPPEIFNEIYAETLVSLSSPGENGRFSTKIEYRRDDSLLIRVRFPLGIEGARILVTPDSAWVFDRVNNELMYGNRSSIESVLPGAVFGTIVVDEALGYVIPDASVDWRLSADSIRYHLESPDSTLRIDVDPRLWRVVHIRKTGPEGTVLEQRWYTDFRTINKQVVPLRLIISQPDRDTRLSMVLRRLETSPGQLNFELGIRDDTRRILIQE